MSEGPSEGQLSVGEWLLTANAVEVSLIGVVTFATGYLVSRYGSTRAVRVAGLAAMPLGTWAIFFPLMEWVAWPFPETSPVAYIIPLLTYPVLAAMLCWLVASATHAARASLGEAAQG